MRASFYRLSQLRVSTEPHGWKSDTLRKLERFLLGVGLKMERTLIFVLCTHTVCAIGPSDSLRGGCLALGRTGGDARDYQPVEGFFRG